MLHEKEHRKKSHHKTDGPKEKVIFEKFSLNNFTNFGKKQCTVRKYQEK